MSKARRKSSSEVDERAKRVFVSALPDNWYPNEITPDKDHLDYRVVILDEHFPTGVDFYVQLKGLETKAARRPLRFSFRKSHVEYWLDRQRRPVLVVLVDTVTRVAFWESIQRWAESAGDGWRNRNRSVVTIRTPVENELTGSAAIVAAVHEAEELLRRKHTPSATDRIAALKKLDDRFDVEIRSTEHETKHLLNARSPVPFSVGSRTPEGVQKLREAFERGETVSFAPGELHFEGGGIFDELTRIATRSQLLLSARSSVDCEFSLGAVDQQGRHSAGIFGIRGQLVGGLTERRYLADLGNGLIAVSGTLRLVPPNGIAVQYQLSFNTAPWTGVPVRALPYFDRIWQFFNDAFDAVELRLDLHILGQTLGETVPASKWRPLIVERGSRLQFIHHARTIAARFALNPPLPDLDTCTEKDADELALLHAVVETGQVVQTFSADEISGRARVDDESLPLVPTDWLERPRIMIQQQMPVSLFDYASDRYSLRYEYQDLTLTPESIEDLRQAKASGHLREPLTLTASPDCKLIVTIEDALLSSGS